MTERERDLEHTHNMHRLEPEERRTLECLAAKWAHEHENADLSDLPAGVVPFRSKTG